MALAAVTAAPSREDFAALLEDSFTHGNLQEGAVIKGTVVAIEKDLAVIDVGLKTEGRVPLREFNGPGRQNDIKVGDTVEVYLERVENALGEAVLSRDKARREESWGKLEKAFQGNEKVQGVIFNQVKGGFTVDLDGAVAFLPRSQVDIRPIRDVTPLMNVSQPFQILKMDRRRGNIVVSRRTVLEETRAEQRQELVQNLEEGQVIDGVVKNITDYGAFVDLGGIDGLLHVTDIAWRRVNHPSEVLNIGQQVKVKIVKINHETHRISLGMKQLQADPWLGIEAKFPVNARLTGPRHQHHGLWCLRGTGARDRGPHPRLGNVVDQEERPSRQDRLHLPGGRGSGAGGRSGQAPHLARSQADHAQPLGSSSSRNIRPARVVEGEVKNKTEFGLFLGLDGDVDGMVHLSDLDWKRPGEQVIDDFKKGDKVRAQVLDVDVEKERISLGIKQLEGDPFAEAGDVKKGAEVTCEIIEVKESGLEVRLVGTDLTAFIKRSELARDRSEQRTERFAVGEKVDARVTQFDRRAHKVTVSIKALEVAEEKEAIAQYWLVRFRCDARRHSRHRAQARHREEGLMLRPAMPFAIVASPSPDVKSVAGMRGWADLPSRA